MKLALILCFCCVFLTAQQHLHDFKLNGNVQSLESTSYSFSQTKTSPSGFLDSELYDKIKLDFDRNGNLVSRENYLDYQGKLGLFDKTVYQFNSHNQIEKQETTLIQNGEEPKKISQRKLLYYLGDRLIRTDEFNFGRTTDQFWVINYIYIGGRLKKKVFWMDDKIFSVTEFEHRLYKIISETTIHNDGKKGQKINFEYDDNQRIKNKTTEAGNEKMTESFLYEKDHLKEHIIKNKQQEVQLKETFNSFGLPVLIEKINYNTNSLTAYKFEYEFDLQNNWINCVILEDGTPRYKIIRKINYY